MDFLRHYAPLREVQAKAMSFNAPPATKTIESATKLLIRTMSLTGVILLAFCLQVSARSDAQQRMASNDKDDSLCNLFSAIEKKSGYIFFCDVTILKDAKLVTGVSKDVTVEEKFRQTLSGQELEYTINDKTTFVKKQKEAVMEVPPADRMYGATTSVSGVVLTAPWGAGTGAQCDN